jgi:hypothetical protein
MALHLNLLHEEIRELRQRQRDPLKIGMLALVSVGTFFCLYYMWNAYRALDIKSHLNAVEKEWAKVEPKVTAAQKRSAELLGIIKTTRVLDDYINNRFFWGPFLQKLSRCVAPNTQLTLIDASVIEEKGVTVSLEGVAAGREPRSAAEDLRQMLVEELGRSYHDVKVEFKALEDLETVVNIGGTNMAMAHYILTINFNPSALAAEGSKPAATPTPEKSKS